MDSHSGQVPRLSCPPKARRSRAPPPARFGPAQPSSLLWLRGGRLKGIEHIGAKAGTLSDAASKPIFVAGPDRWRAMADKMQTPLDMRVDRDTRIFVTEALHKRLFEKRKAVPSRLTVAQEGNLWRIEAIEEL